METILKTNGIIKKYGNTTNLITGGLNEYK